MGILIVTGHSSPIFAQQDSDVWFRNFGLKEGLPAKKINDITQGPDGFIWLASLDGLVRYDGYEFKSFRILPQSQFPTGNFTDRVVYDGAGNIWVGYYYSNFIGYYDTQAHEFVHINLGEKLGLDQEALATRLLGVDAEQNIWISYYLNMESAIILKIDGEDQSVTTYTEKADTIFPVADLFANHVPYSSMHVGRDQTVWLGSTKGLLQATEKDSLIIYQREDAEQPLYIHNILDRGNELWLATDQGLWSFDKQSQNFAQVRAPEYLQQNELIHFYEDRDQTLWISSLKRTYRYMNRSFQQVERPVLDPLKGPAMVPEAEDERYLWFVNNRVYDGGVPMTNGITRYDKQADMYQLFNSNDISGLGNIQSINRLFLDNSGSLWVGNNYTGVSQYPPLFKKFVTHFNTQRFQDLVGNSIYYRAKTSPKGHYVVGTGNGKVFIKHARTGEEKVLAEFEPPPQAGGRNLMNDLMFQGEGSLLVATQLSGLKRITYDPQSLDVQNITTWSMDEIGVGRLSNLLLDDQGNLWISGLGVSRADLDTGTFEPYHTVDEYNPKYDFGEIGIKDSEGNFWYYGNTEAAIKKFNPVTKELIVYNYRGTVPEKLRLTSVEKLLKTFGGSYMLAGRDNLFILNEKQQRFELFIDQEIPEPVDIDQTTPGEIILTTFSHGIFIIDLETKRC